MTAARDWLPVEGGERPLKTVDFRSRASQSELVISWTRRPPSLDGTGPTRIESRRRASHFGSPEFAYPYTPPARKHDSWGGAYVRSLCSPCVAISGTSDDCPFSEHPSVFFFSLPCRSRCTAVGPPPALAGRGGVGHSTSVCGSPVLVAGRSPVNNGVRISKY